MTTKQFKVHQNLIKDAIAELMATNQKVNKTNIINLITERINYVIEKGNTDLTIFANWYEYLEDNQLLIKLNKYFEKYKNI